MRSVSNPKIITLLTEQSKLVNAPRSAPSKLFDQGVAVSAANRGGGKRTHADRPGDKQLRGLASEFESVFADLRREDVEILVVSRGMSELVVPFLQGIVDGQERYKGLIETMMPQQAPISIAAASQAQQNAELRAHFLAEQPLLTSAQVGESRGADSRNASAPASRLVAARRIFGLPAPGSRGKLYPAWQFRDGEPLPEIKEVLATLRSADFSDWAIALWFAAPTGWLDDEIPCEVLPKDPSSVVEAARNEIVSVSG